MAANQLHLRINFATDDEFVREIVNIENTVIKPIVRRKLRVSLGPDDTSKRNQDAVDLVGEIKLALLAEIQRASDSTAAIRHLNAYAASVAFNACHQYFRSSFPERERLKNKLRYLLAHDHSFALWRDSKDRWLCGFATWSTRTDHRNAEPSTQTDLALVGNKRETSAVLLKAYFAERGGPVLFDDLLSHVAGAVGLVEPAESSEDSTGISIRLIDPQPRIDAAVENASRLRALWSEVLKLPMPHRTALLLNLRDDGGDNLLAALPFSGVASMRDVARSIEMNFEELARIWNELPWDDNRIAEHLGMTRQQVINLRQTARVKLARWRDGAGNI